MNSVCLIGNLTKDVEPRTYGDGKILVNFTVAVSNFGHDPYFIPCTAFGKVAENISKFFRKGSKIAITGAIASGSYKDKDGNTRNQVNVMVSGFDFVEKKTDGEPSTKKNAPEVVSYDDEDVGDLPF